MKPIPKLGKVDANRDRSFNGGGPGSTNRIVLIGCFAACGCPDMRAEIAEKKHVLQVTEQERAALIRWLVSCRV